AGCWPSGASGRWPPRPALSSRTTSRWVSSGAGTATSWTWSRRPEGAPWRSASAPGREPGEEMTEGALLLGGEGGQRLPFDPAEVGPQLRVEPPAPLGEVDDDAAAVGGVDVAVDERRLGEAIDDPGECGPGDAGLGAE